jgi:flagellar hook-associated protein 3 FlgL
MTMISSATPPALVPTPLTIAQGLVADIATAQAQQANLEEQIATGSTINQPSDNPAGTYEVMTLNASVARAQQYVSNANNGLGWLQEGVSTVNQAISVLQGVAQAVESISGNALSGQQAAITGIADQITSAQQQLAGLANTQYDGQYIFSGTSSKAPFDSTGAYVGTPESTYPTRTVAPGTQVQIAITGDQVFGSSSSPTPPTTGSIQSSAASGLLGTNGLLAQISGALDAQNVSGAESLLPAVQSFLSKMENAAAQLGADYQNMQAFSQQATATQQALQNQLGAVQNVNLPQVSTQLAEAQQAYQQALWATAQTAQTSLADFLLP